MSANTKIEWTDRTWNPVTGCTKVSQGCKHCYAERMYERFNGKGSFKKVTYHDDRLLQPLKWKKPAKVFVNSMSDLFHEDVPDEFIAAVFAVMANCRHHTFQILTKRPNRMMRFLTLTNADFALLLENAVYQYQWSDENSDEIDDAACSTYNYASVNFPLPNVWLGVSVENQTTANERIPLLLQVPAVVRFLSCEPLLGPVNISELTDNDSNFFPLAFKENIHWVIAGGESGPGARPMHPDWVRSLRDQCAAASVPFFFKQWGEFHHSLPITSKPHWLDKAQTWISGWSMKNQSFVGSVGGVKKLPVNVCLDLAGKNCLVGADFENAVYPVYPMWRVGKKKAGRWLFGKEYNEFPETKNILV